MRNKYALTLDRHRSDSVTPVGKISTTAITKLSIFKDRMQEKPYNPVKWKAKT